jgi:nucleoside-diphosphate-sugar epimerase
MTCASTEYTAERYRGLHCIVTGGLGFIGSNLVLALLRVGASVTVIDAAVPGCGANLANLAGVLNSVSLINCNIGNLGPFCTQLATPAVIFNVAGEISHSMSMSHPERDLDLNTCAQLRFLLFCRDVYPGCRVVFASTRQLYGKPKYLPIDEDHPVEPIDFNGVHKAAAGHYHLLLSRRGELDCVVLRLSNVYGPRMALHLSQQGVLNMYLRNALEGNALAVYGHGEQLRDPIYIDDVVDAFLRAGMASTERSRVYNVGGPEALTLNEIASTITRVARGPDVAHVPFPSSLQSIDIGSYVSDYRRATRELGWQPEIKFESGIRKTLDYYSTVATQYVCRGDRCASALS